MYLNKIFRHISNTLCLVGRSNHGTAKPQHQKKKGYPNRIKLFCIINFQQSNQEMRKCNRFFKEKFANHVTIVP
jgi:hypothetical protein